MIISFSSSVTFSSKMQAVLSFSLPCQRYTPLLPLQPFICLHDYLGIFDIASQSDLESLYFKSLISSFTCVYPQEEEGVEFNGSFSRNPNLWSNLILHVSQFALPLSSAHVNPFSTHHQSRCPGRLQHRRWNSGQRDLSEIIAWQKRHSPVLETNRRINNPVVDVVTWRTRKNTTQATGAHVNLYSSE